MTAAVEPAAKMNARLVSFMECPHMRLMDAAVVRHAGAARCGHCAPYHALIGIQISKPPNPVSGSNSSPKRSKLGASATSCPDCGSHLLQIVLTVRRIDEMCSRWENTAYFCGPIRTRLKATGRSEKSVTSTPAM